MRTVCDDLYTVRRHRDNAILYRHHAVLNVVEAADLLRIAHTFGRVEADDSEAVLTTLGDWPSSEFMVREHRLTFREAA